MHALPSRTVAPTPEATAAELEARGDYLWQPKWDGIRAFACLRRRRHRSARQPGSGR
jgi:hypothetical protein